MNSSILIAMSCVLACRASVGHRPARRLEDCDAVLVARMIREGAVVIEVRDLEARSSVPGARVASRRTLPQVIEEERRRARCGVILFSDVDGSLASSVKQTVLDLGYDATTLGGIGAWKHVPPDAVEALASPSRPTCMRGPR